MMATRPGADTRLKLSAHQHVGGADDATEDGHCSTCSESSNSLETRSRSPEYATLAHSLLSGDEGEIAGHNVAPVHVANEDESPTDAVPSLGMPSLGIPPISEVAAGTSHQNAHVPPQQLGHQSESESRLARQVNELSARMDRLFAMLANFAPGGGVGQIQNVDPQIAEIEAAAQPHNPSLIEVRPNPMMSFAPHPIMNAAASSSTTAP